LQPKLQHAKRWLLLAERSSGYSWLISDRW
jgi:hypothetical protein